MKFLVTIAVLLIAACLTSAQSVRRKPNEKVPEMDQRCLDCICQASSNCDESLKCHNAGQSYFCGPYVISWAYWHDGGRPGDKGRAHDFETCLNNKTCAEQAVKGYMRKYGQDCDRSGQINCYDFARIHKLGFGSCGGLEIQNTDYWEKFEICYDGYNPSNDAAADYDYGSSVLQARSGYQGGYN
ncbi:lysozyme-like [Uloborus diversus]|uniref:lysozyme-like n=1 Tax=Uloborus diversus TaxID=327109 RepID=UPI00240A4E3F|nr:lysozyme-like [Uloborus diversus]